MSLRESLPWNWGKKSSTDETADARRGNLPAPRSVFDLLDEMRSRPFGRDWPSFAGFGAGFDDGSFLPALDASESDDEIRITVELPGLEGKDVEVSLQDDVLTIKGEKQSETKSEKGGGQWVERRYGSFRRAIPLPADVDADKVEARFKSGVLTVIAPRTGTPERNAKSIPIRT